MRGSTFWLRYRTPSSSGCIISCWVDGVYSTIIVGDLKPTAFKAEVLVRVETVTEGGRRFMAAWRKEEVDAAKHHQEKREATRLGKLLSHMEA